MIQKKPGKRKTRTNSTPMLIYMPDVMRQYVSKLAKCTGMSMGAVIRNCILSQMERPIRRRA